MEKRYRKYEKALLERRKHKRAAMAQQSFNVLNSNDNLEATYDPEQSLRDAKYTGGQLLPRRSEFKAVLSQRKSR